MQLPQFLTDAFPILKGTHQLATEIKALVEAQTKAAGELAESRNDLVAIQAERDALRAEIVTLKESLTKAGDDIIAAKNAEASARKLAEDNLKISTDTARQAADLLATKVGVKIAEAPRANIAQEAKPKSGFEAYRLAVKAQISGAN